MASQCTMLAVLCIEMCIQGYFKPLTNLTWESMANCQLSLKVWTLTHNLKINEHEITTSKTIEKHIDIILFPISNLTHLFLILVVYVQPISENTS